MRNRREFIHSCVGGLAGGIAGALVGGGALIDAAPQSNGSATRREVRVGGKRVKVVDVHAHANFSEVADLVKDTPMARLARGGGRPLGADRLQEMDKRGIDVQALDVNTFWWYQADRDLAAKIVQTHDEGLSKWCAAHPDRFVAFSSPALQFPDLGAEQLEHAVKQSGMRGAAVGGHVNGEPLSLPSTIRSGPRCRFWACRCSCIRITQRTSPSRMRCKARAIWGTSSEIRWRRCCFSRT